MAYKGQTWPVWYIGVSDKEPAGPGAQLLVQSLLAHEPGAQNCKGTLCRCDMHSCVQWPHAYRLTAPCPSLLELELLPDLDKSPAWKNIQSPFFLFPCC